MKERIKNIYKKIIKYPVTIWMLVSIIALAAVYVSYAAYNGTADVKRVVSTQATSVTVFSSNYLELYSNTEMAVKNLRTTTEGNFIVSITVCNYDQMDFNSYAKSQIDYEFKAELVKQDNNNYVPVTSVQKNGSDAKTFYVQKIMDDNQTSIGDQYTLNGNGGTFSYTFSNESLTGVNSYKDSFDICFDAAEVARDVPELFIRVTATPTEESRQLNSGISTLASIISISQGRSVETGWHGSLQETGNEEYDGYNLIIEGSGAGTIDILWDNTKFTMNPAFITLYGNTGKGILSLERDDDEREGWKIRTLEVNSMEDNRYVVQFYKKTNSATGAGNILCNHYVATVVEATEPEP
ncbi:hypothetical protein [Ruminococcus sp.]